MQSEVLVALIAGAVALASGLISGLLASKLMAYRIEQLEKNVEKHNHLVERVVAVEQSAKSAHHRIDGVEAKR